MHLLHTLVILFAIYRHSHLFYDLKLSMSTASEDAHTPKCVPCESLDPSSLLTLKQAEEKIDNIPLWKIDVGFDRVNKISRSFTARNFQSALDAINAVGVIAEREGHHPDLHLTSYRELEIVIYTHSVGGVTLNDVALAQMIDNEVKIDYSPNWLKKNPDAINSAAK